MLQKTVQLRSVMVFLSLVLLTGLLAGSAGAAPNAISRLTISDVRNATFTVSWTTGTASNGTVTWGTSKPPSTAVVDAVSSTTTHYVKISGLSSNTTYYFFVSSGSDVDNNGGVYYQVTTGPAIFNSPMDTINGTVVQSNGATAAPYAIIYLQLQDANGAGSSGVSQLVSTRADSLGAWSYTLSNARTGDFQTYFSFTPGADNVRVIGQGGIYGAVGLDPSPWIIPVPSSDPSTLKVTLNQLPTVVTLASFTGTSRPNSIRLDWTTGTEAGLDGFNLYRSNTLGGVKQKLNPSLIQAKTPGGPTGNSYQFSDRTVVSGKTYYYWIELVKQVGNEEYGPVSLAAYWLWLPVVK